MNILIGYNGGEAGRQALTLAGDFAKLKNAFVYIVTSMEGGASERKNDILMAEQGLKFAKEFMEDLNIKCTALQSVRGLTPGEDLVQLAKEKKIDHIFLGIKKTSRVQKAIMGSTAKYVILKSHCPVTTTKFDLKSLTKEELLTGRRVLVVDDEPDIIETVEEILDMCSIDTSLSFDDAAKLLEKKQYDLAIFDIMGVHGYQLLELAQGKKIPVLMLTAHALTPENLKKSIQKGANSFIPKDELPNLVSHCAEVIKSIIEGKKSHKTWFSELKPSFDKSFGEGWKEKDKSFWSSIDSSYYR